MGNLFSYDGGIMSVLSRITDLIILNLIFVICCLPIITIGPALTALYSITLKMAKNEESYVVKGFFKAFKLNFKISFLSWLILLAIFIFLVIDIRITPSLGGTLGTILPYAFTALLFIWFAITSYLFPYIARFENNLKHSFRNAALLLIAYFPYTIVILAITAICGFFMIYKIPFHVTIVLVILIACSAVAFLNSIFFRIVFKKIEPTDEPT